MHKRYSLIAALALAACAAGVQAQTMMPQAGMPQTAAPQTGMPPSDTSSWPIAPSVGTHRIINGTSGTNGTNGTSSPNGGMQPSTRQAGQAHADLAEAVQVVQRMKSDPGVTALLQRARGVFILPDYGRAARGAGAGTQGGRGVLVTREGDGRFSNPVFYSMGGTSASRPARASGGEVALLLMTDKAVQDFRSERKFSLNAGAGINIAPYLRRAQAPASRIQDVIVWSGARDARDARDARGGRGAYAGASSLGLNDLAFDADANRAYYGREDLSASAILDGRVQNPGNNVLGMVLGI